MLFSPHPHPPSAPCLLSLVLCSPNCLVYYPPDTLYPQSTRLEERTVFSRYVRHLNFSIATRWPPLLFLENIIPPAASAPGGPSRSSSVLPDVNSARRWRIHFCRESPSRDSLNLPFATRETLRPFSEYPDCVP